MTAITIPTAYIDTNVEKFSATQLHRLRARPASINWGGSVHQATIYDPVIVNPNDGIKNAGLKSEADLLPKLAQAGIDGRIKFVMQNETRIETWGLPNMDSRSGRFYGAEIGVANDPIDYDRVIMTGTQSAKDMQYEFLSGIKSKRFLELQKMTGAFQGNRPLNRNQLLDAFHIWCAEHNLCEYFLTLDFNLIDAIARHRSTQPLAKVVRPSTLLQALR